MKKSFLFIFVLMILLTCVSCVNKGNSQQTETGLASEEEVVDSAATTASIELCAEDTVEAEPIVDASQAEEWDVSVRTTDLEEEKPRYEAIFRDANGKTIQVAEGYTVDYPQDMLKPFGNVWQADVNFDGHTDIMICLGMMPTSDQTITYYDAWLYNPQTGKFDYHEGFRDISNPEVDNVNKYVKGHYLLRDGETKQYFAFSLQEDGTQKKLKEWQGK
jgi:hypothetical protein